MATPLTFGWQTARIVIAGALLAGTLGAIVRVIIFLPSEKHQASAYTYNFPETVPLSPWQLANSQALPAGKQGQNLGRRYYYRQNGEQLQVEVRYERYTDSNISRLLHIYTPIKGAALTLKAKHQPGVGYYALLQHQQQAYLSACLNPIGESTITQQQFTQNRYQYGWSIQRGFLWAIGQDDLMESRCFWTLLSTPLPVDADTTVLERAQTTLESAWFDWYHWWQSQKLKFKD